MTESRADILVVDDNVQNLDALVGLRLELPLRRSGARGRLAQRWAEHEQQRLARAWLERQIRIGVLTAFEIVRRSRPALNESQQAVQLLEQTVESELHRFRLGSSTLFAVLQAEDSLTSSLLSKIEGQRSFATALIRGAHGQTVRIRFFAEVGADLALWDPENAYLGELEDRLPMSPDLSTRIRDWALRHWGGRRWLLIKKRDETAQPGRELPPESVVSGRRIEELA